MDNKSSLTSSLNILERLLNRITIIGDIEVDKERFYTPGQTAEILGCSHMTIQRMVADGCLIRSEVRKKIFYKGEDIINTLESSRESYM